MPYIYPSVSELQDTDKVGSGDCVPLVQIKAGAPLTSKWREGAKVRGNSRLPKGTAIATFENGRYANRPTGNHAALYMGQNALGILVMDQWKRKDKIRSRLIYFRGNGSGFDDSDNGDKFSVIE
ncbi:BPSL0067 family protein [Inhella sp.]|uniref:BPSL0067 family protein n=1 Tax=Inhella sp. TaxID=1921806 RepID=UPI0035B29BD1